MITGTVKPPTDVLIPGHDLVDLASQWHQAPRRWGHEVHALCSYMAMFPPTIPHYFISWLTQPGDVVWDPFSGRGTTPFEACLLGRVGLGGDASPLAWMLTASKVDPPRQADVDARLQELRGLPATSTDDVPDDVRILFGAQTLSQLVSIRHVLDPTSGVDRYLLATLAGGLHANAGKDGVPRGLTVAMPNTFAMSPQYVRRYIKTHGLTPPDKDVIDFLERRLRRFPPPSIGARGAAWRVDATQPPPIAVATANPKLIFFSPPYLQVMSYGKFNWIRLWLLGEDPRETDSNLFRSGSLPKYLAFMHDVLAQASSTLRTDGYCCVVIGDVRRDENNLNLAASVAQHVADLPGLRLVSVVDDHLPTAHKVSRIWGESKGRATKTDRILIFAGKDAPDLPKPVSIDWRTPERTQL